MEVGHWVGIVIGSKVQAQCLVTHPYHFLYLLQDNIIVGPISVPCSGYLDGVPYSGQGCSNTDVYAMYVEADKAARTVRERQLLVGWSHAAMPSLPLAAVNPRACSLAQPF